MTCIVAVVQDEYIFMGADSAFSSGYSMSIRPNQKVFANSDFLIGCAGSARAGNLIKYKFTPPQITQADIFEYMVTGFVEGMRECLKQSGNATKSDEFEYIHGRFLVGFYGRLFMIDGDMQVQEVTNGYDAIGAGEDLALGVLYATPKMPARRRINLALEASAYFNTTVRAPFSVIRVKW